MFLKYGNKTHLKTLTLLLLPCGQDEGAFNTLNVQLILVSFLTGLRDLCIGLSSINQAMSNRLTLHCHIVNHFIRMG